MNYDLWIIFLLLNILICLVFCINCNNPVYSVLFLMLAFINLFLILIYIGNTFVPTMILFIYVGAMSILLIFVLMLVDVKIWFVKKDFKYLNVLFISLISFFIIYFFYKSSYFFIIVYKYASWRLTDFIAILYTYSDIVSIGFYLFNFNFFPFVIISLILFVALIGSISIVIFKNNSSKKQSTAEALKEFFNLF
jgi:NADH-quinone oxidoreductase subunit J